MEMPTLLIIPVAIFAIGLAVMIFLNKRGNKSGGVAQDVMKKYVEEQVPHFVGKEFSVINLMEDAINAQHMWVIAYDEQGMFMLPSLPNPFTQTIKRYEDTTPINIKKQIAGNLFTGNKTEEMDYVPFVAITNLDINRDKKKISITVGDETKKLKFQSKDCFGAEQEVEINHFLNRLQEAQNK